jgi:hypothetical protein
MRTRKSSSAFAGRPAGGAPSLSMPLPSIAAVVAMAAVMLATTGCNEERKQQCDKFVAAMRPLETGTPGADAVDKASSDISAIPFTDQPLGVYAKNYVATLTALSNTLKLKDSAGPDNMPDGTNDAIKARLKEARTDFDDITRYCSD